MLLLLQEVRQHKARFLKTCCILLATLEYGLVSSVTGPALHDLSLQVSGSISSVSLIVSIGSAGNWIGSILCTSLSLSLSLN